MTQTSFFVIYVLLYAAVSASGLYLLKATPGIKSIAFLCGLLLYGSGFIAWIYILKKYPLSIAFPVAAGTLIVFTQVIGYVFLNEKIYLSGLIGSMLITFGIILLNLNIDNSHG
jgi:multidrug transporter EmrE-like cation transporter